MNWALLKNSLEAAGIATVLALAFGVAAALFLAGTDVRWRKPLLGAAAFALALPPFLVTNCWLHYLGANGVWRKFVPADILTVGGTAWILALILWPIALFATLGGWERLEPSHLESDPGVKGWDLVRGLLWPIARPALGQAAILIFVLALNNFAVPTILQVKVFPAEMWVRFNTTFDAWGTIRLGLPLIIGPILLLLLLARREISWPHLSHSPGPGMFRRQLGRAWFVFFGILAMAIGLLSIGLPLVQLASAQRTWTELSGALAAGKSALWNSFMLAAVSATLVTVAGLCSRPTAGARRWGLLFWLPFFAPGVWLGIALIEVFNRPWLSAIYQSLLIVVVAFVIRYLAVGWSMMTQAKGSADRELKDAARLEGATRWQMLRYVDWPQIRGRTAAVWYVVFLLCLWDVESMVLVTPPGGETLALRIFNLLHYGHNAQVNALCLALLMIAVLPLLFWKTGSTLAAALGRGRDGSRRNKSAGILPGFLACGMALSFTGCGAQSAQDETPIPSKLFSRAKIIGTRGTGVGQLNKPRSVAVDRQDNVYVVDMTGRVQKFSGSGAFLLSWQMPQTELGKPKGMCRDKAGNIIVLEPHYQRVNHFTTNGTLVAQWGVSGTNLGQLKLPRSIGVSSRGEIYVSEYGLTERVQRFSLGDSLDSAKRAGTNTAVDVRFISSFGKAGTGPGEFNRPEGLFVDGQDRVYVADSCNHRIQIFSADGKLLRAYGKPGTGKGELSYPYDICVDAEGRQYVCEFGNSRIQVFDAQDQPIEIIGGPGAQPGFFSNPWSVALDSAGNLYVADSLNHRVQKLIRATNVAAAQKATRASCLSLGFASLILQLTTRAW